MLKMASVAFFRKRCYNGREKDSGTKGKTMKYCVRDLIEKGKIDGIRVIAGEKYLDNEIEGVTIIEAPDIVRFILSLIHIFTRKRERGI